MEYAQSLLYLRENKTSVNIIPRKGKLWNRLAETHVWHRWMGVQARHDLQRSTSDMRGHPQYMKYE